MAGCCGRRRGAHAFWNLAMANPTTLEHLGLDRTDRPAWWPRALLRDLGPPPGIGCPAGLLFISVNFLYVGAGLVGVWQCARLGCCSGWVCGGGEWVVFVVAGNIQVLAAFERLPTTLTKKSLCNLNRNGYERPPRGVCLNSSKVSGLVKH